MPESTKITFAEAVARVPRFRDQPGTRLMRKIPSKACKYRLIVGRDSPSRIRFAVGVHDRAGSRGEQADQTSQFVFALDVRELADVPIDERLNVGIVETGTPAQVATGHCLGRPTPDDPVGVLGARYV
jgi:hypothetical protein